MNFINTKNTFVLLAGLLLLTLQFTARADVTFVHTDHLGTPVAYSDAQGNVIGEEATTPFGESLNAPTGNDQPAFTGHVRDGSTGLVYMQARYYDPVVGRFMSTDPVGFESGGVDYFNRYSYVNNRPLNATDPTGAIAYEKCIACPGPIQNSDDESDDDTETDDSNGSSGDDGGDTSDGDEGDEGNDDLKKVEIPKELRLPMELILSSTAADLRNDPRGVALARIVRSNEEGELTSTPSGTDAIDGMELVLGGHYPRLNAIQDAGAIVVAVPPWQRENQMLKNATFYNELSRLVEAPVFVMLTGIDSPTVFMFNGTETRRTNYFE